MLHGVLAHINTAAVELFIGPMIDIYSMQLADIVQQIQCIEKNRGKSTTFVLLIA